MTNEEMSKELAGLAREAMDYKAKHDLTTTRLIREFPGLGSDKTLGLIASGDPAKLEDLDLERWLAEYRATIGMMRTLEEKKARKDEVYDDLTTVKHLRLAVMEAMTDRSNSRLVLAVGPSGSGKSTALEMLQKKYGAKRVLLLEADETWKSPGPMLDAIAHAHGRTDLPPSLAGKLAVVLGDMRDSRVCLAIDEAHHMGVSALNLIKTLINRTPCEVVLAAMDSLMKRLEWGSYEEVRQLTQNRLAERVRYGMPASADVGAMVIRRTGFTPEKSQVETLGAKAAKNGHLKFVTLVCRKATKLAGKDPVTADILTTAMDQVERTR